MLTVWAIVGAAPGQKDASYRGSAGKTGLPGALVNAVLKLKEAADAFGIDVVRDRGAAKPNGVLKDIEEGLAERVQLDSGEAASLTARSDSGPEKTLVGINVADSGEQRLVEQGGFDGEAPTPEQGCK